MRVIWERITEAMHGHGWVAAQFVATQLSVHVNTVRPELHKMLEAGLVDHDELKGPHRKGAPTIVWRLVSNDSSLERKCRDIADALEAHGGTSDAETIRRLVRRSWALRRQRDRKTDLLKKLRVRVEANARLCEEALGLKQGSL